MRLSNAFGRSRSGVTLLELLIVIVIICILTGLLFPALSASRRAAHQTGCQNNIRQITLGLQEYVDTTRGMFPLPPEPDRPIGWALSILPFVEETSLANQLDYKQPLSSAQNMVAGRQRPELFVCPVMPDVQSSMPGIGVSYYIIRISPKDRRRATRDRRWQVFDVQEGSTFPWFTSPEMEGTGYPPPHPSPFGLLE